MAARFQGRVALVTGAARGMGRACAQAFAREGARVAALDLDEAGLDALAREVAGDGGVARAFACDVTEAGRVRRTVDAVVAAFGGVDVLVNNAGVLRTTTPAERIDEAEWDLVTAANLRGPFLVSKAVLPLLRARGRGRIVNLSSSAGRSTSELGGAHYTASKAGLLGLTRHLAREYGPHNITVNAVCPGLVDTPMIHEHADEARLAYWRGQIPAGRFATPAEAAELVLFLASDAAAYINGASIDLNGGSLLL